jgi:hypothetical protein
VLLTVGRDTVATFKWFNSPYTQEEYDKLELLIKEIQDCDVLVVRSANKATKELI